MNDEEKILELMNEIESTNKDMYINLLMCIIHNRFGVYTNYVDKLYSIVGMDNFTKIIDILGGCKVTIPTKDEFQDALLLTTVYFYKEIKGLDWKEIQKLLPNEPNIMKRFYKRVWSLNEKIKDKLTLIMEDKK